jgi:hypothetical protein
MTSLWSSKVIAVRSAFRIQLRSVSEIDFSLFRINNLQNLPF